jgi:flagellar hook protein FlgE
MALPMARFMHNADANQAAPQILCGARQGPWLSSSQRRSGKMSLFGALSTAISGLTAQSAAFTNISNNTANSQTVGYKGINTSFIDYLTSSGGSSGDQSGSVGTISQNLNEVQGTIEQSTDPLALAIDGQGFFAVSETTSTSTSGTPNFSSQQYYTRAGDFQLDSQGYLVNSAGEYLNAWQVNPSTGEVNTSTLAPIQVQQRQFQPVATSNVALIANVPATPSPTSNLSSQVQIYDAAGTAHELTTTWTQLSTNNWQLTLTSPDNASGPTIGSVDVAFNPNGTLASLSNGSGLLTINSSTTEAGVTITPTFNGNAQTINLDLGAYNGATGVTQFAGTDYDLESISQNGSPPGAFTSITTTNTGAIQANYNNGQSVTIAQVPVITFENADALQSQNGQAFTATEGSGAAISQNQNQNGAGSLVTGSVEESNTDIATQLSQLIVAQQAYGANAKVVTTASQLLQTTLDMKQ